MVWTLSRNNQNRKDNPFQNSPARLKEAIAEYINVKVVYAHKVIAETAKAPIPR
jgi:hypothetical protein